MATKFFRNNSTPRPQVVPVPPPRFVSPAEIQSYLVMQLAASSGYEWKLWDVNMTVIAMWDGDNLPMYLFWIPNRDARARFVLTHKNGQRWDVPCVSDGGERETSHSVVHGIKVLMDKHAEEESA